MENNLLSIGSLNGCTQRGHATISGYAIAEAIARATRDNPMEAPPFSFPAHLHHVINGSSITFFDVVGWGDQPLNKAAA